MTTLYETTDEHRFVRIKNLGLKPGISDEADYDVAVGKGLDYADKVAQGLDVVPQPGEIKALHYAIFERIHPWAGDLRETGSKIFVGDGLPGDPPAKLEERLRLLCEWSKEDFAWAGDYTDRQALAIASFHVALKRIQCFEDGNGRTAGIILDRQVKQCFGLELGTKLSAEEYWSGLVRGLEKGEVKELAMALTDALQLARQVDASKSQALQDQAVKDLETVARGGQVEAETKHRLVHERLADLRMVESVALRNNRNVDEVQDWVLEPQRQRAVHLSLEQAQTDWVRVGGVSEKAREEANVRAAMEEIRRNSLEVSPAKQRQENDRVSGEADRRAAAMERVRQEARELAERRRIERQEQQDKARSQSESRSHSQSY